MVNGTELAARPSVSDSGRFSRFRPRASAIRNSISRNCGFLVGIVGAVVVAGWILNVEFLTNLNPAWASMKFNTAVLFVLSGYSLLHLNPDDGNKSNRRLARAANWLVVAIGFMSVCEYVLGTNIGIDEILIRQSEEANAAEYPGRMSLATACGFVLLGASLLLTDLKHPLAHSMSLFLAWCVAAISLIAAIGYVYGVESLYVVWPFSSMALHTAILFGLAATGILGSRHDRSPLGFLALEGSGSDIARRILPFAISMPVAIGWLTLIGQEAGLYELRFGLGIVVTAIILALVGMIWIVATTLNSSDVLNRKAMAAIESEATRRRALFENARDGILVLSNSCTTFEANASFAEMLGYDPEELAVLQPCQWRTGGLAQEAFVNEWASRPESKGQFETELQRKDGTCIQVAVSYTRVVIDGEDCIYCIYRDVSEQRAAQRELRNSQTRFMRALANIPDVVVIYSPDLRIQFINDATTAVTGMAASEFIGRRDDEIFPEDVYGSYLPVLQGALDSKETRSIDTDLELPNGDIRSLLITCVPILDEQGEVREILGITHDYTKRRQAEFDLKKTEEQYRQLVEQAADGIFITDQNGGFELVNTRCCELLGFTREELLSIDGRKRFLLDDVASNTQRITRLTMGEDVRYERVFRRKDKTTFPAEVSVKKLGGERMQVIFHDISIRQAQDKKIQRLSRIQSVLSGINSAIVRIRDKGELLREACRIAISAGQFRVAWIGELHSATGRVTMLAQDGLPFELTKKLDAGPVYVELLPDGPGRFCLNSNRPVFDNDIEHSLEMSQLRRDAIRLGAKSVIALPLTVEGRKFGLMVLYAPERQFFDEEELKLLKELAGDVSFALDYMAKEERANYLAFYDPLSKLPNRNFFFEALRRQLRQAELNSDKVVLQVLDIERFGMINESYGRDAADRLICCIAGRISSIVGENDTVARVGSDSFAVAISGDWQESNIARQLEGFIASVFGEPFDIGNDQLRVVATFGVAVYPGDGGDEHVLLSNAEAAQRSSVERKMRYMFYSPKMNESVADSIRLENKLRRALEQNEFLMWYQPKMNAKTGAITGLEALIRWEDAATGDLVRPGKFVPALEQMGLIRDAGRQAMAMIVQDCRSWAEQEIKVQSVAVNISLIQLREDDFISSMIDLQSALDAVGCALEIELTESVIMENIDEILSKLQTLRGLGIQVSVDDFGTGYSSLAYISRLPIYALKIDKSFVFGLSQDDSARAIVAAIISLARSLNLKVVAEGVETGEQAQILRELGCDELQGYYFGYPASASDVTESLRNGLSPGAVRTQ